jgi:protein SCO1/2
MRRIGTRIAAALLAPLLAVAAGCGGGSPTHEWRGKVVEPPVEAPPLSGVNWDGERFALDQLAGKVVVVFFGYTYCPDICPFTLSKMKRLRTELGEQGEDLEVVFVSVDPHRDSVEKLAQYVPNFGQDFYGLRLEFGELEEVQEAWAVTVQYGQPKEGPGTDSFYYVDHTGTYFVVGRDGKLRVTFPPNAKVEQMLPDVRELLSQEA